MRGILYALFYVANKTKYKCVRNGRFFTIGSEAAELFHHKKGDIIFNAEQTKQIFEKGKITHGSRRGRSFADGDNKPEDFDWIDILLNRSKSNYDGFKDKFDSSFIKLTERFSNFSSTLSELNNQLVYQQDAYTKYIEKANSLGLGEEYAQKIRDGSLDISTVNDDGLKEKIKDYQTWYEKALACSKALNELNEDKKKLYEDNFNNIDTAYDNILNSIEHKANILNGYVEKAEENGYLQSTRYYETLANIEKETLGQLKYERNDLINSLNEAVNSGEIEEYSEAWYKLQSSIDDTTESIQKSENELIKFGKEMRQITWDRFDYMQDTVSKLTDESEFLIDLFGDDLFNDNGSLNKNGNAVMGLHGLSYNVDMQQSLSYAKELQKIESELANNPEDTKLIARKQELLKLQRESILSAEDEKQAMVDLVKDGFDVQLDALQKLIDTYEDSLDSAKDLYEYQQSITEHTKDIAAIEKQLSAYQNDTSEESKAKIQKLKTDLADAQKDLRDTEYDKYVSDQKELLDNLYTEYEDILNERLDNVDSLISDMIDTVNSNSYSINSTLKSETGDVGIKLSKEMQSVWTSENQALSDYFSGKNGGIVLSADGYFENLSELTGLHNALDSICNDVNAIMQYASIVAKVDIDPEGSKNQMIQNSLDWFADDNSRNSLASENEKYGKAFGYTKSDGSWYDSDGNLVYSVSDDEKIRNVIAKMKSNSAKWSGASDSDKTKLEQQNESYANKIASLSGQSVYKDGNGTWWIGDKELYSYKNGGLVNYTGLAQLDGTPSKPELVLNAKQTENYLAVNDKINKLCKKGLSIGNTQFPTSDFSNVVPLSGITDISGKVSEIRKTTNVNSSKSIGDINITIPIEHVDDYNDFVSQLQKDKKFEKFIGSITVDKLAGGSSLEKNKYRW